MNRRDFTRGLASLGLVPALPLPAVRATPAAAASATALADKMYFVGWYTARMRKSCSADILVSELKVDGPTARKIFDKLVSNGTVTAPDGLGISRTVDPLRNTTRGLAKAARPRPASKAPKLKTPVAEHKPVLAENDFEEETPPPHDAADETARAEHCEDVDNIVNATETTEPVEITPPTGTPQTRSVAPK